MIALFVVLLYFTLLPATNGLVVIGTPLILGAGEDYPSSAVIDSANQFAYFAIVPSNEASAGQIARINLRDFVQAGVLSLNSEDGHPYSAAIDPMSGFAYFGTVGRGQSDAGSHSQGSFIRFHTSGGCRAQWGRRSAYSDN